MKEIIKSVFLLIFSLVIIYLPLAFSAWSFNPENWNHLERFALSLPAWLLILWSIFGKFIPKPTYKI